MEEPGGLGGRLGFGGLRPGLRLGGVVGRGAAGDGVGRGAAGDGCHLTIGTLSEKIAENSQRITRLEGLDVLWCGVWFVAPWTKERWGSAFSCWWGSEFWGGVGWMGGVGGGVHVGLVVGTHCKIIRNQ